MMPWGSPDDVYVRELRARVAAKAYMDDLRRQLSKLGCRNAIYLSDEDTDWVWKQIQLAVTPW